MSTSRSNEKRLKTIEIFASENSSPRKIAGLKPFLKSHFPTVDVRIKPSIFSSLESIETDRLANDLATARVKDLLSPVQSSEPMYGEIDYELRSLQGMTRVGGIVYDGRRIGDILLHYMLRHQSLETTSIVLTDRLISTFSTDDLRHHLRTLVCGFPSIVSVPGIVEAPAKPREFYLMKQKLEARGSGELEIQKLKAIFRERFIDYGDSRARCVLEGLVLQALVFHLTLEPFCSDSQCRFFNAHWQEDLIRTQVESPRLCARHERILALAAKNPVIRW